MTDLRPCRLLLLAPEDVVEERKAALRALEDVEPIARKNSVLLQASGWSDCVFPGGTEPLEEIFGAFDYIVAILWTKIHMPDSEESILDVLDKLINRHARVWLYFSNEAVPQDDSRMESANAIRQFRKLKASLRPQGFNDAPKFEALFRLHLQQVLLGPSSAKGALETTLMAEEINYHLQVDASGRAFIDCTVTGLRMSSGELSALSFRMETTAGIIQDPVPGKLSDSSRITWHSVERPIPEDGKFEEILASSRMIDGEFRLFSPLKAGEPAVSLDFRIEMHNAYATSSTEFNFYYPKGQVDVDDFPLPQHTEFFFRPIWVPTGRITLAATVPGPLPAAPQLLHFSRSSQAVVAALSGGCLLLPPEQPDSWKFGESEDLTAVETPSGAHFSRTMERPIFGDGYELRWRVPEHAIPAKPACIAEASDQLLEFARQTDPQRGGSASSPALVMSSVAFERFAARIVDKYASAKDFFDVTLMVFDPEETCLRVVLGVAKNAPLPQQFWRLRLPPGVGTAGEAFKTSRITWYVRPGDGSRGFGIYLPIENNWKHMAILCVPVVHPDFHLEAAGLAADARDALVPAYITGLISLGSRSKLSPLFALGNRVRSVAENTASAQETRKVSEEIAAIATDCQEALELVLARAQLGRAFR